jgi:hypothetical protein
MSIALNNNKKYWHKEMPFYRYKFVLIFTTFLRYTEELYNTETCQSMLQPLAQSPSSWQMSRLIFRKVKKENIINEPHF